MKASANLLREPFGRPKGLPLSPGRNGRPRCFSAVLTATVLRAIVAPPPAPDAIRPAAHGKGWQARFCLRFSKIVLLGLGSTPGAAHIETKHPRNLVAGTRCKAFDGEAALTTI